MDDDDDYDFDAIDRLESNALAARQSHGAPIVQPAGPPSHTYPAYQAPQNGVNTFHHPQLPPAAQQPWHQGGQPQQWQPQAPVQPHWQQPIAGVEPNAYQTTGQGHAYPPSNYQPYPPAAPPQGGYTRGQQGWAAPLPPPPQPASNHQNQCYPPPQPPQQNWNQGYQPPAYGQQPPNAWQPPPQPSRWQPKPLPAQTIIPPQPYLQPQQQGAPHEEPRITSAAVQQSGHMYLQQAQQQQQPRQPPLHQQPKAPGAGDKGGQRDLYSLWGVKKQPSEQTPQRGPSNHVMPPQNNVFTSNAGPSNNNINRQVAAAQQGQTMPRAPVMPPIQQERQRREPSSTSRPAPQQRERAVESAEPPGRSVHPSNATDLAECDTTTGNLRVSPEAAQHWVYPAGVPEREYQISAISSALLRNTLVCLPTGLGKTLIAAVVMHNFTRWFPESKVVFAAPTRPLVSQQIEACRRFMGLAPDATAELTGRIKSEERKALWDDPTRRVFFCTPQTFYNDVKLGVCPYDVVSCVVVDECHRATGQSDIAQALRLMRQKYKLKFRVLGLSATPGSSADQVQEVITNLGIATVHFRNEEDPDVSPYVHKKVTELMIVETESEEGGPRALLLAVLQRLVGHLAGARFYFGPADAERVSRYGLVQAQTASREAAAKGIGGVPSAMAQEWFRQAAVLADLRDSLDKYGVLPAAALLRTKMAEERCMKLLPSKEPTFSLFQAKLEAAAAAGGGGPRLAKLVSVLRSHFEADGEPGGVIVFASLRDGVQTIVEALRQHQPLIRAKAFVGQGGGTGTGSTSKSSKGTGMNQKEQKETIKGFSTGEFNVLVATCIGEEGLDIPAVDLIVCYDATASPTRAVQRQGRTGRHREGKVVYILGAGKEEEHYHRIYESTSRLHSQLRQAERYFELLMTAPRMLPRQFTPERKDIDSGFGVQEEAAEEENTGAVKGRVRAKANGSNGRGRGAGSSRGKGGRGRGGAAAGAEARAASPLVGNTPAVLAMLEAGAARLAVEGPRYVKAPPSPLPSQPGATPIDSPVAPHRLLFPSSSAFIRPGSNGRRLAIAPPPSTESLLATAAAAAAVATDAQLSPTKQGKAPGGDAAGPLKVPTPQPRRTKLLPELHEDGSITLPSGKELHLGKSGDHPVAFLVAAIARPAQTEAELAGAGQGAGGKKRKAPVSRGVRGKGKKVATAGVPAGPTPPTVLALADAAAEVVKGAPAVAAVQEVAVEPAQLDKGTRGPSAAVEVAVGHIQPAVPGGPKVSISAAPAFPGVYTVPVAHAGLLCAAQGGPDGDDDDFINLVSSEEDDAEHRLGDAHREGGKGMHYQKAAPVQPAAENTNTHRAPEEFTFDSNIGDTKKLYYNKGQGQQERNQGQKIHGYQLALHGGDDDDADGLIDLTEEPGSQVPLAERLHRLHRTTTTEPHPQSSPHTAQLPEAAAAAPGSRLPKEDELDVPLAKRARMLRTTPAPALHDEYSPASALRHLPPSSTEMSVHPSAVLPSSAPRAHPLAQNHQPPNPPSAPTAAQIPLSNQISGATTVPPPATTMAALPAPTSVPCSYPSAGQNLLAAPGNVTGSNPSRGARGDGDGSSVEHGPLLSNKGLLTNNGVDYASAGYGDDVAHDYAYDCGYDDDGGAFFYGNEEEDELWEEWQGNDGGEGDHHHQQQQQQQQEDAVDGEQEAGLSDGGNSGGSRREGGVVHNDSLMDGQMNPLPAVSAAHGLAIPSSDQGRQQQQQPRVGLARRRAIIMSQSPGSTPEVPLQPLLSAEGPSGPSTSSFPGFTDPHPDHRPARLNRLRKAGTANENSPIKPINTAKSRPIPLQQQQHPAPGTTVKKKRPRPSGLPRGGATAAPHRFLDTEAQLSGDEGEASEDEGGDGLDDYESDFIDDGSQFPSGGGGSGSGNGEDGKAAAFSTPAGPASLAAFHHRRLHEAQHSPSPGEYLKRLQRARLGRHGAVDGSDLTPQGTAGAAGYPLGSDDYDREDSFIDDGEEEGDEEEEDEVVYDTPAGRDSHSDACGRCGGGTGELLLCDACPAVYHLQCVGLREVPLGDWYCPTCMDAMTPEGGAAGGVVQNARPQQPQQQQRQVAPPLPLQRVQPPPVKQQPRQPPKQKSAAAAVPRKHALLDDSDDDFA